jgi:hypothetical protein
MSSTAYVVRVAAVIALVYGLYVAGTKAYSWMKGPEPGSRPWQVQKFRQDRRECSHFADRREAARRLLAWKPKPGPCIAAPAPRAPAAKDRSNGVFSVRGGWPGMLSEPALATPASPHRPRYF